jgi:shikimate 5-dehydrogenase
MMSIADSHGVTTINGLTMLVEQASKAAEYWFGEEFSNSIKKKIEKDLIGKTDR